MKLKEGNVLVEYSRFDGTPCAFYTILKVHRDTVRCLVEELTGRDGARLYRSRRRTDVFGKLHLLLQRNCKMLCAGETVQSSRNSW